MSRKSFLSSHKKYSDKGIGLEKKKQGFNVVPPLNCHSANNQVYQADHINDTLFGDIRATLLGFLSSLLSQGILGEVNGVLPYSVVCDSSNNSQARIALGYVQADIAVQYQGINEKFIVNLQGGTSVSVSTALGSV